MILSPPSFSVNSPPTEETPLADEIATPPLPTVTNLPLDTTSTITHPIHTAEEIASIENIKNAIEKMDKFHHIEILKILKKHNNIRLNENKSGVFVNMMFIPKEVLEEVTKYLDYISEQEKSINNFEKQQEELRKTGGSGGIKTSHNIL